METQKITAVTAKVQLKVLWEQQQWQEDPYLDGPESEDDSDHGLANAGVSEFQVYEVFPLSNWSVVHHTRHHFQEQ